MTHHAKLFPLAALALLSAAGPARSTEIMRWQRMPLAIPLNVGEERIIFVDRNVRVGVPATISDRLRVQTAAGAVYLRASERFASSRVQLKDVATGAVILLDVAAGSAQDGQPPLEPIRIVDANAASSTTRSDSTRAEASATPPEADAPLPILLTRYAAQSLYAPLRAIETVAGVVRVGLRHDLALDGLLPSAPVQASALAAWRYGDVRVSAVRLRNTSTRWLVLDPRELQGDFAAATFQHATLGPLGTPEDTTVVYLVTQGRDLLRALPPAVAPFDASLNLPSPGDRNEK